MNVGLFALPRYLTVLLLCAAAYAIGRAALRSIKFDGFLEKLTLSTALGLGVIAHLVLFLGLCGWLIEAVVVAAIGAATAMALLVLYVAPKKGVVPERTDSGPAPTWRGARLLFLTGAGAALLPLLLLPLYPPTEYDITAYHLAAPKHWLRMHTVDATPFLRYQVGPNLAHTLFASLMGLVGDVSPQILSLAAVLLIAGGLCAWGRRLEKPAAGIFAAALWLGSPATLELAPVASYHALAALFAFASVYALSMYAKNRQLGILLMAGTFLGFAQSTWLGVFSLVPAFIAAALYLWRKERRLAPLFALAGGTLIGWGPTLLRSAWFTGNPTYPLFTQILGTGPWWTAEEFGRIESYVRRFGVPRTILGFILLPYSLVVSPGLFQQGHGYSMALSFAVPFVIVRAIFDKVVRWLAALVLFYVICWFCFGQIMRYLLPIIPILCLSVALTACWLGKHLWASRTSSLKGVTTAVIAVSLLFPSARLVWKEVDKRGPVPLTENERANYVAARIPDYKAVRVANRDPGPIYGMGVTNSAYYAAGDFMGDSLGPGRYSQVLDNLGDADLLRAVFQRLGAKYLLISVREGLQQFPSGPAFDRYFEPIYGDSSAELYRIPESPRSVSPERKNLLANAGFEELRDCMPASWSRRGTPIVEEPDGGTFSETVAVEVSEADGFQQFVKIEPGETYEVGLQAKASPRGKILRIQVNWHNESGQTCDVYIRLFEATPDWQRYVARFTAPSCATNAEVYATAHGPDWVWLDSFEFSETGAHSPAQTTRLTSR